MIAAFAQDIQDKDNNHYITFFLLFSFLLFLTGMFFSATLTESAKSMLLSHDETVASSLLSQAACVAMIRGAS